MEIICGRRWAVLILVLLILGAGCSRDDTLEPTVIVESAITSTATVTEQASLPAPAESNFDFITVATDAPSRFGNFEDIDEFGNVVGFDADVMAELGALASLDYEFVVTSFSGLLTSISGGEFDVGMSALIINDPPEEGLAYTIPYLEVGQVLMVRANESNLQNYEAIGPGTPIGAQRFTSGEQAARDFVGADSSDLQLYDSVADAIQALIDGVVEGVILDNDDAVHFTSLYPQQLKIAGGSGEESWISRKAYGIAVAADNQELLERLNEAITIAQQEGAIDRLIETWLVSEETIVAGESLVGTPDDELVIGIAGELPDMDPAARDPDLIGWEVKLNTMSGLLMVNEQNMLTPRLAEDFPLISEDKLEYTFKVRPDLTFPDGSELAAEDVKFSIDRAAGLGNFQVNRYLKDDNEDGFIDGDAVQVIDSMTIKFVLKEPASFFPSVLATPPFFIIDDGCSPATFDPGSLCDGIGAYTISEWDSGEQMRLRANPEWPGEPPAFENIQLRFYDDPSRMRRSLENDAIDIAWTGLGYEDVLELRQDPAFTFWEGSSAFKSYLVFEQGEPPWDNTRLRQAIASAVDREALASAVISDSRQPLSSPVPKDTPGHIEAEPDRNLDEARAILTALGYSPNIRLEMTVWYLNDGRYTPYEAEYAQILKEQLEETELIQVTLEGAPWSVFRPESAACNYPAFLLGWPSSGQPASYNDAMSWMDYFLTNTDSVCSNYDSESMSALLEEALEETDEARRLNLYGQMQELWAQELPTLDLTQEPRTAISQPSVSNFVTDAMGLLHYDILTKTED
jgi:peptide/nickel transport system substrate-binding protein